MFIVDGRIGWSDGAEIEDSFYDGCFHDMLTRVTGDAGTADVRRARFGLRPPSHNHYGRGSNHSYRGRKNHFIWNRPGGLTSAPRERF